MDEALASKQLGVEQKANVVAALNSIGVAATTSETWAQLIAKMAGVIKATGNATVADVLSGKTFSNTNSNGLTGTIPKRSDEFKSGTWLNPSGGIYVDTAMSLDGGYYPLGTKASIQISDSALIPDNIKKGVSIFGVQGINEMKRGFTKVSGGGGYFTVPYGQTVYKTGFLVPDEAKICVFMNSSTSNGVNGRC
ncbi:hypothetical protein VQ056_22615 [Paenibacillus sp. JTLBN-2024]